MSLATGLRAATRTAPLVGRRAFQASSARMVHFLNATPETFKTAVANKEKVVLVDFYADWCGPCKMLSPILEKLTDSPEVKSGSGKALDLVTVDTDQHPTLAQEYAVSSLPTVIAFKDGKPVSKFIGAMPEGSVRNFLSTL
ncbi:thioredoxin-like protein [Phanerochaete sordida]|uniref:Thioredoxin-like protein n=1 Tax=Phanerochaete sordida TaxID=48140 RepID=A0A9P3LPA2_9APHY|nr:thioredoxin-like protein [Phanerochaete sordida]